jgi:hypothetical protein
LGCAGAPTGCSSGRSARAEREALDLIEKQPGLTVAELADALGVGMTRVWQIVGRLESGRVRRERR